MVSRHLLTWTSRQNTPHSLARTLWRPYLLSVGLLAISLAVGAGRTDAKSLRPSARTEATAEECLGLHLKVGQRFGNIFSKTVSYQGGGIEEDAGHVGGSALYEVIDASSTEPKLRVTGRYDGRGTNTGIVQIRDHGQTDCSMRTGKCHPYLDDSGNIFDAFLWGNPTGKLLPGMAWTVQMTVPWELGPPGAETVTVVQVDPVNHEVMLKREGSGQGFFDNDSKQITVKKDGKDYKVDVVPGKTHWVGYTVFREGLTVSDEMLETRQLVVSSKDFGTSTINERQFTLLNQSPADLL